MLDYSNNVVDNCLQYLKINLAKVNYAIASVLQFALLCELINQGI